jgi:hypothetical protein
MRLRGPLIAFCLTAAFAAGAAVVYKWTDADGVVHYSDQEVPGAERIVTSSGRSNGIGGAVRAAPQGAPVKPGKHLSFSQFAIESPAREQVFFADDVVPVRLGVDPGLHANQRLVWTLNGSELADLASDAVTFVLPAQPRGTYVLTATVTDPESGESQTANAVTFYFRQPSDNDPLRRK